MTDLPILQIRPMRGGLRYAEAKVGQSRVGMDLFVAISRALADFVAKPEGEGIVYRNARMAMVLGLDLVIPRDTARDFIVTSTALTGKRECSACGHTEPVWEFVEITWDDLPFLGVLCGTCSKEVGLDDDDSE